MVLAAPPLAPVKHKAMSIWARCGRSLEDPTVDAERALGAAAELDIVLDVVDVVLSPAEARPQGKEQRTPLPS